jgi:hypothetical protein
VRHGEAPVEVYRGVGKLRWWRGGLEEQAPLASSNGGRHRRARVVERPTTFYRRASRLRFEGKARKHGGSGAAGGSGGHSVGAGIAALHMARAEEWRGGLTHRGTCVGKRAARGTHAASGLVVAGDRDVETVAAPHGGTRGCALERGAT